MTSVPTSGQHRHAAGTPAGGRLAPVRHSEADVALDQVDEVDDPMHLDRSLWLTEERFYVSRDDAGVPSVYDNATGEQWPVFGMWQARWGADHRNGRHDPSRRGGKRHEKCPLCAEDEKQAHEVAAACAFRGGDGKTQYVDVCLGCGQHMSLHTNGTDQ